MKKLVLTFAQGKLFKEALAVSQPLMEAYAKRIGADFKVGVPKQSYSVIPYAKAELIEHFLGEYDRVMWVDCDALVSPKAPDIFEEVPEEKLGLFNEAPWIDRSQAIEDWKQKTGFLLVHGTYYNTGVMVVSQCHKSVFSGIPKNPIRHFEEQTWLNQKIAESDFEVHELSHLWNRMSCTWRRPLDPFGSYIVHFAGLRPAEGLPNFMRARLKEWEAANFEGKEWFIFVCSGGMGNQLATCPVIEEMIHAHPNGVFSVHTPYPDAFSHLKNRYKNLEVISTPSSSSTPAEQEALANASAKELEKRFSAFVFRNSGALPINTFQMNPVDFASLNILGRQLQSKKIRVYEKPCQEIQEILSGLPVAVIHAGRSGWKTKDVPREIYQEAVYALKSEGYTIVQVGQKDMKTHGEGWGASDLDGVDFDFMDASFDEFMTVLRCAEIVVTNDSMPLHAAAATDADIICITIAKHPELLNPHREFGRFLAITAPEGKNHWELVSRRIPYIPTDRIPGLDEWVEGMEWPTKNYVRFFIQNTVNKVDAFEKQAITL